MHDDEWRKNWKRPTIEHGVPTKWQWLVLYPEKLLLGDFVDIGAFTLIVAKNGVEIRDDVEIGPGVKILSESTIDNKKGPVVLKYGSRIGANSVVMPNVKIGKNAVVAALSFVNRDVPDDYLFIQRRRTELMPISAWSRALSHGTLHREAED